jgi:hypothetical protein
MLDAETGGATTGFTYSGQYGVRRASTRPDNYRTQFGSMSADDYLTPMLQPPQRHDNNIARRLSRNSFLIPPQTLKRRNTDGMLIKYIFCLFIMRFYIKMLITLKTIYYLSIKIRYWIFFHN